MSAELPTQLMTTEDLGFIWQYEKRTIATWTGGRKKKPQITLVRNGKELRFMPKDVLEHILAHRVLAERAYPAGASSHGVRLLEEDIERIERFIELRVKAEFAARDRKEHKTYPVRAMERNAA